MATYKGIQGYKIDAISADPTVRQIGQIWYNTTDGALRYTATGAWASITSTPTGRQAEYTMGTATAMLIAGGNPPETNTSTEWDGSSWAAGGSMANTIYNGGACGTQTAGLRFGGYIPGPGHSNSSESYNGTSWASTNNLPGTVESNGGAGTSTSAMNAGGSAPGGLSNTNSCQFTGTCWNAGPTLNSSYCCGGALGDSATSALTAGGVPGMAPPGQKGMQEFNGVAWVSIAALLLEARMRTAGMGGSTAAIVASGANADPAQANTIVTAESWNGTSWSSISSISITGVANCGGSTEATAESHMIVGGVTAPAATPGAAQVYTDIKTVTSS